MADTLLCLGQQNPAATTLTTLYTVPAATEATVSSVVVCNRTGAPITFRVSLAVGGAADDPKQYLWYDVSCPANDTFIGTIGVTMAAGDVLRVYAGASGLTFQAFGVQVT